MALLDQGAKNDSRQRRALQRLMVTSSTHEHVGNETPAGAVDGANVTFTLASTPAPSSLQLFKNGLMMCQGATDDYTLAGAVLSFNGDQVPQAGDKMRAWYIRAE
jgi:hypothetical protein